MTKITEQAFKRAEELARAEAHTFYSKDSHTALARLIQDHSDKAKALQRY